VKTVNDETRRDEDQAALRFAIYRRADARDYGEHNLQRMDKITPVMAEGLAHYAGSQSGRCWNSGTPISLIFDFAVMTKRSGITLAPCSLPARLTGPQSVRQALSNELTAKRGQ
jgi:hypothetical protein